MAIDEATQKTVVKSLIDISVVPNSESNAFDVAFKASVVEYKSNTLVIQLDFTKPEQISTTLEPDMLVISFWSRFMFQGDDPMVQIARGTTISRGIKKQVSADVRENSAKVGGSLQKATIFTFAVNYLFKGGVQLILDAVLMLSV